MIKRVFGERRWVRPAAAGLALASILTGCAVQRAIEQGREPAVERDCNQFASAPIFLTDAGSYTAEARSSGGRCADASISLTLRAPNGAVVYADRFKADALYGFNAIQNGADMRNRLLDWIDPPSGAVDSTGDLPFWRRGARYPGPPAAPFIVDEGVGRTLYNELREANFPAFCYAQDRESLNCVVLEPDAAAVEPLGVQVLAG